MRGARILLRLLGLLALLPLSSCPGVGQMLRLYGYVELKPPSKLFAPGTMVWVKSSHPFSAGVICTQEMSLGGHFVPLNSPTAAGQFDRATDKEFALDASYLDVLRADARFADISNVRMKLDNPVLYELTDVDVIRHAVERSPICRHALGQRRNAGYKVTMIASALKADVTYTVMWKRESRLSPGGRVGTLKNLALELGADSSSVSEDSIAANDLYWGIKDDMFLASLSDPDEGEAATALAQDTRLIGANTTPTLSQVADVDRRSRSPSAVRSGPRPTLHPASVPAPCRRQQADRQPASRGANVSGGGACAPGRPAADTNRQQTGADDNVADDATDDELF